MGTLVVMLPASSQVALTVADNTLVYDGTKFVQPYEAKYVMLYTVPVSALSLPFNEVNPMSLQSSASAQCIVVAFNPVSTPNTDPSIEAFPDPSMGQCIVAITCHGTKITYVQVS